MKHVISVVLFLNMVLSTTGVYFLLNNFGLSELSSLWGVMSGICTGIIVSEIYINKILD